MRTQKGIALSKEAREFKKQVAKQVREQLPVPLPFTNTDVFKLSLQFVLKTRFFIRDTSNFIKLVEDCIFDEIDINDARNIELECKKSYFPKSDFEFVLVTLEKSEFDYDYFSKESHVGDLEDNSEETYTKTEMESIMREFAVDLINSKLHTELDNIASHKAVNKIPKFLKKPKSK